MASTDQKPKLPCQTKLIEDIPSEDDYLGDTNAIGPHRRLAEALSEIILSKKEKGGKMIGLEGSWGTGKTSIICILSKMLSLNKNITITSFDAWAHEGDPLRRTYLETLIRHFQSLDTWIDKAKWDDNLKFLTNKKKITKITKHQKSTMLGRIFSLSLLFIPVGIPFINQGLRKGITIDSALPFSWIFITGLLLISIPAWVLIFNSLHLRKRGGKLPSDWAFLTGDTIEDIEQNVSESPDPTSIEFEDCFKELMRDALSIDNKKKAVIVIDNLDRIAPHEALSIWSTLQTFLQYRSNNSEKWLDNLWVIVPYDPTGLKKLWAGTEETSSTNIISSDKNLVTQSFIDKSFQLRFEVPPLVLTNWKSYLIKLIKIALPEHDKDDQHAIYRVLNTCDSKNSIPTPRELITFVNQIGAIHRQWNDKYPLKDIAYYVIKKRKNEHATIQNGLINGEIPDNQERHVLSNNINQNLSGLLFNVDPELGQQLLLSESIYDALKENKHETITSLENIHKDGFWAVIEEVMTTRLVNASKEVITNAAMCLKDSGVLDDYDGHEKETIIKYLKIGAYNVKSWFPLNNDIAKGFSQICIFLNDIKFSEYIIKELKSSLYQFNENKDIFNKYDIADTVKQTIEIFKSLSDMEHEKVLISGFPIAHDHKGWLKASSLIINEDEKWWGKFNASNDSAYVINDLSKDITTANAADVIYSFLDAVKITSHAYDDCDWEPLIQSIENMLLGTQPWDKEKSSVLLEILLYLREQPQQEIKINTLVESLSLGGHLLDGYHQAHAAGMLDCKVKYALLILEFLPTLVVSNQVRNSANGIQELNAILASDDTEFAKEFVDQLKNYNKLDILYKIIDARNEYSPLIVRCLRMLTDDDTPETFFTSKLVIEHWNGLIDHLDEEPESEMFDNLISYLIENTEFLDDVISSTDSVFDIDYAGMYSTLCRLSSSKQFQSWCGAGLVDIDLESWTRELQDDGDIIGLLQSLANNDERIYLKITFQDALFNYLKNIIDGEIEPSLKIQELKSELFKFLDDGAAIVLRRKIRDYVVSKGESCSDLFFKYFGSEISDVEILTKDFNIITNLFRPLIENQSLEGLKWLEEIFTQNTSILTKFKDKPSKEDFLERLQSIVNNIDEDTEANSLILSIARLNNITKNEIQDD